MQQGPDLHQPAAKSSWRRRLSIIALATILGGIVIFGVPRLQLLTDQIFVLATVGVYAIAAQGLGFVYGESGQLSVAHGTLVGTSAYAATILVGETKVPFTVVIVAALAVSILAAVTIAALCSRLSGYYAVLVTFAVAGLASVTAATLTITGGTNGRILQLGQSPEYGWISDTMHLFELAWSIVLVGGCVLYLMRSTRFVLELNAIRENETLARSLGVRSTGLKLAAFAVSGVFGGVAGVLWPAVFRYVSPVDVSYSPGITFIMILLLGGARSLFGPLLGALLYVTLPYLLAVPASQVEIASGIVLIAVILVLPYGLVSVLETGVGGAALQAIRKRIV